MYTNLWPLRVFASHLPSHHKARLYWIQWVSTRTYIVFSSVFNMMGPGWLSVKLFFPRDSHRIYQWCLALYSHSSFLSTSNEPSSHLSYFPPQDSSVLNTTSLRMLSNPFTYSCLYLIWWGLCPSSHLLSHHVYQSLAIFIFIFYTENTPFSWVFQRYGQSSQGQLSPLCLYLHLLIITSRPWVFGTRSLFCWNFLLPQTPFTNFAGHSRATQSTAQELRLYLCQSTCLDHWWMWNG